MTVWSWKMMLLEVCKLIFNDYPTEMLYLATKDNYLHSSAKDYTAPVVENCHVWASNDTRSKRNVLLYIFKELGIDPSILELELVPLNNNVVDDNVED